jgi:hypothetical protein
MAISAQELSLLQEFIEALTTSFNEFKFTEDLRHESHLHMFHNLHTLHIKFESSSSNQSIVNVLPLSDEDDTNEIDDDGLRMYPRDEIKKESNPNDDSDSTIDYVSNSIKDMVNDTPIVNSSNFLCPPPLSYFTSSDVSLGFESLSPPTTMQKCGHSSILSTKLGISVVGLPLIIQIDQCLEQLTTPHLWDTMS